MTDRDLPQASRLFRITGGSNPYSAEEIAVDFDTGVSEDADGYSLAAVTLSLWEENGFIYVPVGAKVRAFPNLHGSGTFLFRYFNCVSPIVYPVQIDTYFTTTGSPITAITITKKYRDVTVNVNGCTTLGAPYCVASSGTCSAGEPASTPTYWCYLGACYAVYSGATAPTGAAGPYTSAALCAASPCTYPATVVVPSGCSCAYPLTIHGTWTGAAPPACACFAGTFALVWNGTSSWVGTFVCGPNTITVSLGITCAGANATFAAIAASAGCTPLASAPQTVACGVYPAAYTMTLNAGGGANNCCGGSAGSVSLTFSA